MHNLAPTRALARRSRQLLVIAVVIAALGAFIIALGVLMTMIPFVAVGSPNYPFYNLVRLGLIAIGSLLFLLAVGLSIRAVTWRIDNDLAQDVGRVLAQALDARYTFIRNISRRDIGYIDAVLVGPPGALVFRIMNEKGIFANEGANWLKRRRGGGWAPWSPGPTRQVVADIKKLRDYLAQTGLGDVPVYGVIVFLYEPPLVELQGKDPVVPPTHLSTLITNLQADYFARDRIDEARVVRTGRALFQG
jgi:hypothetical protein